MTEGLAPPFIQPTGPLVDDDAVLRSFVRNEPSGYSRRLHVERPVLFVERFHEAALHVGPDTMLVRLDHPDEYGAVKRELEDALLEGGMTCQDEQTMLGLPAAFYLVGLRLSAWDLWGKSVEDAFCHLRRAAVLEMPPVLG